MSADKDGAADHPQAHDGHGVADDGAAAEIRQLVKRCLDRDERAAFELVERYQSQVFGLCYRMVGQRQDAEDVAQETFVRALRSLKNWDGRRDLVPWLLAIAGNRCRTLLASRARKPQISGEFDHVQDPAPPVSAVRTLAEEVHLALSQVRLEYRQAFVLFHEQELSYAEIAAAMNCPVGTVKTWVHRARRELIDRLRAREVVVENRSTGGETVG